MKRQTIKFNKLSLLGVLATSCLGYLAFISPHESVEAAKSVATHIGTFEGSTTFTTSSSNGINPGLFIEVMDDEGNLTQYESEEGIITIPDTKEGAYVTQAKLLGKTKYVDQDTGEILDTWEEGRNLRLESVEEPGLTTGTSRNMWSKVNDSGETYAGYRRLSKLKIPVFEGETIYIRATGGPGYSGVVTYDENGEKIKDLLGIIGDVMENTYIVEKGVKYIAPAPHQRYVFNENETIMYNRGSGYLPYEENVSGDYKINMITVNEDITLRGVGDVRDELDLITGEVTERIGEIVLDGSDDESWSRNITLSPDSYSTSFFTLNVDGVRRKFGEVLTKKCDKFPVQRDHSHPNDVEGIHQVVDNEISIRVLKTNLLEDSVVGFKSWLSNNPLSVQFQLTTESIKTVALNSNYFFKPINKDSIQVTGTITPLVGSITVPTTPVSFVLNPNEEVGQQFIAPEFSVVNETNAPIRLSLNHFEQTTQMLNDVLPDKYESWEGLNKQESKDIALALVPKVSDRWLSLNEGPRYVVETSNNELGTIKAKSSVDFTFLALHGQAFEEALSPSYRLGFVFEFMN